MNKVGSQDKPAIKDQIANIDGETFDSIFERFREGVYYTAYRICQNEADAQEIVSITFLKVFEHRQQFAGRAALSTWIYRIAYNSSLDLIRRKRREVTWEEHSDLFCDNSTLENLVENISREQQINQLKQAMQKLSPQDRALLGLRFDRGLSYEEIAAIVDLPVNTVGTKLYRAKKQLLHLMKKGGQADD